jgi:Flp pilus assembly protein TadD
MKNKNMYKANLEALKIRFPSLYKTLTEKPHPFPFPVETFSTKNNEVNAAVTMPDGRRIFFYEEEDIVENTQKTLSAFRLHKHDILMCIGMGLGYLPLIAAHTIADKPRIAVVEPYVEVFDFALQVMDLRKLFSCEKLDLFVGEKLCASEIIHHYQDILYAGACRRLVHLSSRQIFGPNFFALEKEIDENINSLLLNWNTVRLHGEKVMHNAMQNLSSLFESVQLGELKDKFKCMPAICVASGPSLSKDLPAIKAMADRALILACDSAVKPLADAGIVPHMIFVVDHDQEDFEKLRTEAGQLRQSILVYFVEANVDSVRGFLGEKRVFVSAGTSMVEHWLGPELHLNCGLGGTVSSNGDAAVLTAVALGADPIVLAGMDLAFSEGKDHANGCAFRCEQEDELLTLTDGVRGFPVYSLPALVTGKVLLEKMISASKRRFIDSSLNGAFIKGAKIKSLVELEQTETSARKDICRILENLNWTSTLNRSDIEIVLSNMASTVSGLEKAALKGLLIIKNRNGKNIKNYRHSDLQSLVKQGLIQYQNIIHRFDAALNLINCMRYEKQLETDRKIINLGRDKKLSKEKINKDTLVILKGLFSSIYRSAKLFETLLTRQKIYFENAAKLTRHIEKDPDDTHKRLELARLHATHGIVWMAEREYRKYLGGVQDDVSAWAELIKVYMDIKLWKEAKETLQQALQLFPNHQRLIQINDEMAEGLAALMMTAQQEMINSQKGDKFGKLRARHAVINYLYAVPDDAEAKSIEMRIHELDELENRRIQRKSDVVYSPQQLQKLKDKAKWCIGNGNAEQAVGIYEGLASAYPQEWALYREKIGDIRFGQNDFPSALWNYQQAWGRSPQNMDLKSRIQWARPLADAHRRDFKSRDLAASIIVPFDGNPADIIRLVANLITSTTVSHEIILTIRAGNSDALNKIRMLAGAHQNIHAVAADFAPDSPQSINAAILSSAGNYIVLLSPEFTPCPDWLETLLDHVSDQPRAGIVHPIVTYWKDPADEGMSLLFSENEQLFRHRRRPMKSCDGFFVLFKRELLMQVGLMDEAFNGSFMMLEDFSARCAMEGFDNIIAADIQVRARAGCPAKGDGEVFDGKWKNKNLPQCLEEKKYRLMLFQEADELVLNGDVDGALIRLINAIALYPKSDWIYFRIAQALITESRFGEALEALNAIPPESHGGENTATRQGSPESMPYEKSVLWALASAGMGKTQEAQAHLDQLDQMKPDFPITLHIHGTLARKQKDVKAAEAYFRKTIAADPGFGAAYAGLSNLYADAGDAKSAFGLLKKAFALSPDDPDILSAYHFAVMERGCHEDAENLFNEGVNLFPDNKRLHYLRIDVMLRQEKYGSAVDKIDDAIIKFGEADGILEAAEHIRKLAVLESHP